MIAVIADDLTGAAELAGIGLDYQLKTEVSLVVDLDTKAELLIIAANTRGLPEEEAKAISKEVTGELMKLQPELIFKKIDSVLRGNILEEVVGQMEHTGQKRALIIPGNPLHQKTVLDGIYYYKGQPVHQSAYAVDPEYPATSAQVKQMLRAGDDVQLLKVGEQMEDAGVYVGDITTNADYRHWINQLNNDTALVGASGLFEALVKTRYTQNNAAESCRVGLISPKLFVLGSTFHQGKERPEPGFSKMAWNFLPASIAAPVFSAGVDCAGFINEVVEGLKNSCDSIIAINPTDFNGLAINPKTLAGNIAAVVEQVLTNISIKELLIEGGATASAIIAKLGIACMYPVQHLAPGVIRLSVPGDSQLYLTLKPGSYEWPALALE